MASQGNASVQLATEYICGDQTDKGVVYYLIVFTFVDPVRKD